MSSPLLSQPPLAPFRGVRGALFIAAIAAVSGAAIGQAPANAPATGIAPVDHYSQQIRCQSDRTPDNR